MASAVMTVRVEEKEKELIAAYAEILGVSVSEFARTSMLERIEDEFDIIEAERAYAEYLANPKTYTSEEVEAMFL